MTAINKGKHVVSEISGVRCTIVETGLSEERMKFLKEILEFNGYEVKTVPDKKAAETDPDKFTLGVTDILFNPVIALYERLLKTRDGKTITPAYWNQDLSVIISAYWRFRKRTPVQ
jgi:hypothetical protein